jgi:hypothetical protein
MADINIPFGSGDTAPTVRRTLRLGGVPVNLNGATVTFLYSKVGTVDESNPQLSIPCTPFDAAGGVFDFEWTGEVAQRGSKLTFSGQYKAVLASGKPMHFPNNGTLSVVVTGEP